MKKLFILAACLLCLSNVHAQWKIGPKAYLGVVAQSPSSIEIMPMSDHHMYDLDFLGSSSVSSLGFMMFNDIGPIFLQAEMLATSYRLDFMISDYKKMAKGSHIFNEQYYVIEVPISAGLRISDFKLGLGPVMEFNLDMDSDMAQLEEYSNKMRNMDFSFQAIAGYKIGILHIDIKYINKFSSITDGFALGNDVMKYNKRANRLMFGLGVTF